MKKFALPFMTAALLIVAACSHDQKKQGKEITSSGYTMKVTNESVAAVTKDWPLASRAATNSMINKYGLPNIVSADQLIWYNTAPFKRTVVYKDELKHQFPYEHSDVLVQVVDYRVPRDKLDEISQLDGSLLVDRTKGELAARSDKEEMNFLALNLADKVIRGDMSVEQAKSTYEKSALAFSTGTSNRYLTGLNFRVEGNTADPGLGAKGQPGSLEAQEEAHDAAKKVEEIQSN
ncbi:hypothetical protein [Peredibacter starrii]|uniref:Lipoprotein n=1 Tax=Peredibacter starrii TaxID=28202 RepID=A0AAX4HTG2_9BACT|nr:hypothetical protein [Peredibacter starrii]WPU66458.1 hypothetical protein SOO65_06835 [Peredibacter starrii]